MQVQPLLPLRRILPCSPALDGQSMMVALSAINQGQRSSSSSSSARFALVRLSPRARKTRAVVIRHCARVVFILVTRRFANAKFVPGFGSKKRAFHGAATETLRIATPARCYRASLLRGGRPSLLSHVGIDRIDNLAGGFVGQKSS